ncbi:soxR reducing system protein RseC [bacterium BMS3Abin07]|nr:soxR reducing system protein RseC [bacterium BMS3Abin07]GBE31180.1 soxR reducing system protein RseC [bacterium BMS3Bbin05]
MEEIGVIKSVDGIMAKVIVRKTMACDHCVKGECDMEGRNFETEAINAVHAKVGQTVKIVMKAQTYIKGAIVLYILPVFSLIIGAILGQLLLPAYFTGINTETLAVVGAFFLFFLSLVLVKFLSGRMEKNTEYKSVVEKILENENANPVPFS